MSAFVLGWSLLTTAQAEGPLDLADLTAYRAALGPVKTGEPAPAPATFRDLWDRPADFRGRRVSVGGRVERIFRQGAVGEFPSLAEVWVVDEAANPICLVGPDPPGRPSPTTGDAIRFEGTFLRRVRYRGGDVDRLAPLVVGPGPFVVERPAAPGPGRAGSSSEWVFVAVLAGVVALALLRAHLRGPVRRPIVEGPRPEFHDGPPADVAEG